MNLRHRIHSYLCWKRSATFMEIKKYVRKDTNTVVHELYLLIKDKRIRINNGIYTPFTEDRFTDSIRNTILTYITISKTATTRELQQFATRETIRRRLRDLIIDNQIEMVGYFPQQNIYYQLRRN